jgi:hypothetical protein
MKAKMMEKVRRQLGFDNLFVVDCVGRSGGLAMLWMAEAQIEIQNFSRRHINIIVRSYLSGITPWKLTGFYGHPVANKRDEGWSILRHISTLEPGPWICLGDFNEILNESEKWGGRSRPRGLMESFQGTLEACGLSDLGFKGPKYTWSNCQEGLDLIKERLDRVVANRSWCEFFREAEVWVGAAISSDHAPITLHVTGLAPKQLQRRPFRYEAGWELEPDYKRTVEKAWSVPSSNLDPWQNLLRKIGSCQKEFQQWRYHSLGRDKRIFQSQCEVLARLQGEELAVERGKMKEIQNELQLKMEQEDIKWRQRSKTDWLQFGDKNSKFFHACANQRRRSNQIHSILDEQGLLRETQEDIGAAFTNYFNNLFATDGMEHMEEGLVAVEERVTGAMNETLLQPFNELEIRTALFQMGPLKAPGPDGLNAGFFQKNWEVVGPEVSKTILSILNSGEISRDFNSTFIALIPKTKNPLNVTDFRPISLCNVIYKMVSKVLANRLKLILPHIISSTQSAFIPGRLITDNVLAAYETLHTMHANMWGRQGYMAVKIDMSKAYDRVEWEFLRSVMSNLGFDPRWIRLIMMCVTTANYEVLVNGIPAGRINPTRGIRQGDPISPYLFLICAEALSAMLTKADNEGVLRGVPSSKRGPRLNHLFFC